MINHNNESYNRSESTSLLQPAKSLATNELNRNFVENIEVWCNYKVPMLYYLRFYSDEMGEGPYDDNGIYSRPKVDPSRLSWWRCYIKV